MTVRIPCSATGIPPASWLTPLTRVQLCGQWGRLYVVSQNVSAEAACFVWKGDPRSFSTGASPLLLACEVSELYHQRHMVWFPEAVLNQTFEIDWLEVSCDDTLSVVLRALDKS